ncbi:methyl-CpG-binding domain-containing protein 11-like isoform X2 [Zingiber officinale]|uniref:methyl-CpG-binding domain-containing protein 11-like isoform X2 n=1 Tax=Zingiber officinale TaxID=94328 RepID=UPI001C4CD597|nr:methyl-CpG-binding domain-containing protein 11-like isoform X2 [Zingiber officinale]
MAEQEEIKGVQVTPEKAAGETEPDAVELTAPAGWTKKFVLNEDGTPRRNEILFISPTGEEIKSRRQLQQYLKAHPGSPSSAEFDWRTGDTPRRSARIREKAKAVEVPEDEKPKKRERKASSKKETKEKATEGDEASPVKEDITTEVKEDVSMQEVADVATKVDDDANKAIEEGVAVGESLNEKKDPVLESNGSDENKTEASSENKEEATPRAEPIVSLPADDKNSKHNSEEAFTGKEKHDGDISTDNSKHEDAVLKELPSASCGDAQHLPKASPVNC